MPRTKAVLLDVYETAVSTDFDGVLLGLARAAGVPLEEWTAGVRAYAGDVTRGSMGLEEAFSRTVEATGRRPGHVSRLVRADLNLLVEHSRVHPDVWPFLDEAREHGLTVVLISNCAPNTRPLLQELGILRAVHAAALSCEVRSAKPDPGIYHAALRLARAAPKEALMVDDQDAYCQGARALGIPSVLIDRSGRVDGAVTSLGDLLDGSEPLR